MKTKIRLSMKITTALLVISMVTQMSVMATGAGKVMFTGETSYHDQPDFSLENWMVEPAHWATGNRTIMTEIEETISMESWMLDLNLRSIEKPAGEASIQLESWMTDVRYPAWNVSSRDPELILEDWMCDLSVW
jgi:hypothetical protein